MSVSMVSKKGDSTNVINVTVKGLTDYTGYYGILHILLPGKDSSNTKVLDLTIDHSTDKFEVFFMPAQTSTLEVDTTYLVVFEIYHKTGEVVDFRRELSWPLEITKSLINVTV